MATSVQKLTVIVYTNLYNIDFLKLTLRVAYI